MTFDPATISAFSALAGSAIGALASVATTWLTQHHQDHMQRQSQEASHREQLFTEFIDEASKIYAEGLLQARLDDPSKLVPVYACINKLRLFATQSTIEAAQSVLERIVETYESPPPALEAGDARMADHDVLRTFADCCRAELTDLRRHPGKPSFEPRSPVPQLTRSTV